ncbi:MAG TPA: amino acid ABC transporter substrate-binding protein [Burkholderiales bacterium]|jgi:ABC-type amino acid transport substrate-binding protein|nr:amino acid ABC transporter substrate-binding protein [Burkholderiales bacterium]
MKRLALLFAAIAVALPAAAQDLGPTLTKIRDAKEIVIGFREYTVPFSFVGDDKQPAGYTVDVCKAVAASIQEQLKLSALPIRWVAVTAESRFAAVSQGRVDLECGSSTMTLSRFAVVDFSAPIFVEGGSVLVRADSTVKRLGDLSGKKIAVGAGTTAEKALPAAFKTLLISAEIVVVKNAEAALEALDAGKVDGYANDRILLVGSVVKGRDAKKYRITEDDYSYEPYGLAMRRNDTAFRTAVNRGLAQLYRGPGMPEIYKRWFGAFGPPGTLLQAMYYLNALPE